MDFCANKSILINQACFMHACCTASVLVKMFWSCIYAVYATCISVYDCTQAPQDLKSQKRRLQASKNKAVI
ncbi:hypothetical protein DAI22_09g130850 [Oryza sativa Japonica Group]|nr:hypothetical protein DAI22_09g130850 [Oryza sativa Japonica Group]